MIGRTAELWSRGQSNLRLGSWRWDGLEDPLVRVETSLRHSKAFSPERTVLAFSTYRKDQTYEDRSVVSALGKCAPPTLWRDRTDRRLPGRGNGPSPPCVHP